MKITAASEIALAVGRPIDATKLLAASVGARERVRGLVPHYWVRQHHEQTIEQLRGVLDPEDIERLWAEGTGLTYEEAAERAKSLLDQFADGA